MKYCTYCGNEMLDEAVICMKCGCMVPTARAQVSYTSDTQLITQLSSRLRINGVIWIVLGILQLLLGYYIEWWIMIVGVLNIFGGFKDFTRSTQILNDPRGIVGEHEYMTGAVITLIYNIVVGALIGVIGSIYYFVAIRGFVMQNKERFLAMEQ